MTPEPEKTMSEMDVVSPDVQFHPDYNDAQDSDLILVSSDGHAFRVHSIIMKLASDVFRTMIDAARHSPSQPTSQTPPSPSKIITSTNSAVSVTEPIALQEDAAIIKSLLDIIYPNRSFFNSSTSASTSSDADSDSGSGSGSFEFMHFRDICYAAEKYEMHATLQTLRFFLHPSLNSFPPLLAFALASRYEWTEELRMISTETLKLGLYARDFSQQLRLIPSKGLLQLLELHRKRRDLLVASLDTKNRNGTPYSIAWSSITYTNTRCQNPSQHSITSRWTILKYRLSKEMERKPDGSTIRKQSFWDRGEFTNLWGTKCADCPNAKGDLAKILDKNKLRAEVIRVLDSLPKTI